MEHPGFICREDARRSTVNVRVNARLQEDHVPNAMQQLKLIVVGSVRAQQQQLRCRIVQTAQRLQRLQVLQRHANLIAVAVAFGFVLEGSGRFKLTIAVILVLVLLHNNLARIVRAKQFSLNVEHQRLQQQPQQQPQQVQRQLVSLTV